MENINCIVCKKRNFNPYITLKDRLLKDHNSYSLVKCECGLVYLNPRPNRLEISKYYKTSDYEPHNNNRSYWKSIYLQAQKTAFKWKNRIISNYSKPGNLLDIGAGRGEFGDFMYSKGWNVTIQDTIIKKTSNNKIIFTTDLNQIFEDNYFDVITLWHSLEHIHNIEGLFKNIKRLLKDNGTILIAVPNLNAPEKKIYMNQWAPFDAPRHLYHFNLNTLEKLCFNNNVSIIKKISIFQDTPYNILLSINKWTFYKVLQGFIVLIISLMTTIIRGPNYSSSILIICKKL